MKEIIILKRIVDKKNVSKKSFKLKLACGHTAIRNLQSMRKDNLCRCKVCEELADKIEREKINEQNELQIIPFGDVLASDRNLLNALRRIETKLDFLCDKF